MSPVREHDVKTLNELFQEQVERTPTAVALIFKDQRLTYRHVNERANQLARCLKRRGIGMEDPVGICMRHSPDLIVALLGIAKAGAAYVGLDPDWPRARLDEIVRASGAALTLVDEIGLDARLGGALLALGPEPTFAEHSRDNLSHVTTPDNLFSITYTSGSTGRPKGVLVTIRSVVSRLEWMWQAYPFRPGDAALLYRSYAFVGFALDCFGALLKGLPTVISSAADPRDPAGIVKSSFEYGVTHLAASASLWDAILTEIEQHPSGWPTLRVGKTLGEPLRSSLVERWRRVCPHALLVNTYGATECPSATALDTSRCRTAGVRHVPAGISAPHADVLVVGDDGRVLRSEEEGEVCLGGASLARGYLGQPGMTAERFVPNPASTTPGDRVFRTGDRGAWRLDGCLEVKGRRDLQVKIRGSRVEIEEVEAALRRCAGVRAAAVHARDGDGGVRLVAYLVSDVARGSSSDLRAALLEAVPHYMVPSEFIVVSALPMTVTGKLDRRALPGLSGTPLASIAPLVLPRTPSEQALASIWEGVLGLEAVGLDDNFFELGGQSLTGIQIVSRIHDAFGVEIPLRVLFETATVRALAQEVDGAVTLRDAARSRAIDRQANRRATPRRAHAGHGLQH